MSPCWAAAAGQRVHAAGPRLVSRDPVGTRSREVSGHPPAAEEDTKAMHCRDLIFPLSSAHPTGAGDLDAQLAKPGLLSAPGGCPETPSGRGASGTDEALHPTPKSVRRFGAAPPGCTAFLNVAISMTQFPDATSVAVVLLLPATVTALYSSSTCVWPLPSGLVNPAPGVMFATLLLQKPTISSWAKLVVAVPLFAAVPVPMADAVTSSGAAVSWLANSKAETLGLVGAALKLTVTALEPPPTMFLAKKI